jgi:Tat protein secretion system quality control protein TatD with DNase activity
VTKRESNYIKYEIQYDHKVVFTYGIHPNGDEYSSSNSWVQIETGLADSILRTAEEHGYDYNYNDVTFSNNGLDVIYYILDIEASLVKPLI